MVRTLFPIVGGTISLNVAVPVQTWEDRIVQELNMARKNPRGYAQIIASYRDPFGIITDSDRQETIRYLSTVAPCTNTLVLDPGLTRISADWVRSQGQAGTTGHGDFIARVQRVGTYRSAAENLAYGYQEPRDAVIQWIVDTGIPSKGHRLNIYNCIFDQAGVAKGPHNSSYRTMISVTFGRGFQSYL